MQSDIKPQNKRDTVLKFLFFVFMCATNAHKTGTPFDSAFCTVSFFMFLGFDLLFPKKNNAFEKNKKVVFFYIGFFSCYYASCAWTDSIADTVARSTMFIQTFGAAFILSRNISTIEDYNDYLWLLLLSLCYMTVVLFIRTDYSLFGERFGEQLGLNENDFGMRCFMGLLLSRYFKQRRVCFFTSILFVVLVFFSGSRRALVMLFFGFLLFEMLSSNKKTLAFKTIAGLAFIAISLFLVLNVEVFYNVLGWRVQKTLDQFSINADFILPEYSDIGYSKKSFSTEERSVFLEYAWRMFLEKPILGWGGNGFKTHMRITSLARETYSHNNYLELLSTLGIVGFSIYYYFIFKVLFAQIRLYKRKNKGSAMAIAFIVANLAGEFCYVSYYMTIVQVFNTLLYIYFVLFEKSTTNNNVIESENDNEPESHQQEIFSADLNNRVDNAYSN